MNLIDFRYGYCGHEMLNEVELIDMGGRVYDPALGRFLSCDNYVQEPTNSQNFNRYSYCLNNPLRYTDPTGESFVLAAIIGGAIGAYVGGSIANGTYNPTKWDFSYARTWGLMFCGGMVGAVSGYVGAAVAASNIPAANTLGIMSASYINSLGTHAYTLGETPILISAGIVSYDLTNGRFGYLGRKGNSKLENWMYGLGALANLADMGENGNLLLNTEKKDVINHSAILDENQNRIISIGPGKNWIEPKGAVDHYLNRCLGGSVATNEYTIHGNNMIIKHVNISTIKNYGKVLDAFTQKGDGILPYSFLYSSCSTHTGLALNLAGIPNLFVHPYTVQASVWLWNQGITPVLINNSYHLQNGIH